MPDQGRAFDASGIFFYSFENSQIFVEATFFVRSKIRDECFGLFFAGDDRFSLQDISQDRGGGFGEGATGTGEADFFDSIFFCFNIQDVVITAGVIDTSLLEIGVRRNLAMARMAIVVEDYLLVEIFEIFIFHGVI